MNRRNLLAGILAAGIAPAVARSGVLMPVREIWVPPRAVPLAEFEVGVYNGFTLYTSSVAPVAGMTLDAIRRIAKKMKRYAMPPSPRAGHFLIPAHPDWVTLLKGPHENR